MEIIFHEEEGIFHLSNEKLSYIIRIMENGQLEQIYYGKRIHDREGLSHFHEEALRSQMSICIPEPGKLSLNYTRQEYPGYGSGDYRSPAFVIRQENGSRVSDFRYRSHEIFPGKEPLLPLPATYAEDPAEALSLKITLFDELTEAELCLSYTIYRDYPVITRNARFLSHGKGKLYLERALSMSLEFPDKDYQLLQLSGAWGRERYVKKRPLEMGLQGIQSLNGTCSGAEQNPFLALLRGNADEFQGEVYGFSLVYSGNFLAQAEVSTFDLTRLMLGIHPEGFCWELGEGESFQTPEVVLVYSDQGLNGMSRSFHRLYRKRLMRGKWRDLPRPILLNNWEATFFDFDEEKILRIAKKAKEVGAELFVLDDGWFGKRNNDYQGLGDWQANLEKLPDGIAGLSRKIEALGLHFGLWVELEMVNKDSELYRAHPDWLIGAPGRFESHARHQYVLDFSRQEVVDYLYEEIAKIIRSSFLSYIKWDMNRYMTEPYSRVLPAERQGEMMHRYILGVYQLYRRLTEEFPEILFESCASGGARFDAGLMYFAPQTWCSDDTDAGERMKIQYGTSYVYPIVSMGSHVSAVPNMQVYRRTPLETRANVAYFGTFGYELDLNLLPEEEIEEVKKQVRFMKEHRELLQVDGDFYRLRNPFEGNETAWMVVSRDQRKAIAAYYQRLNYVNASAIRLRLRGLKPDGLYALSCDLSPCLEMREPIFGAELSLEGEGLRSYRAYGDELMEAGIPIKREDLSKKGGDFASLLFLIREEGE